MRSELLLKRDRASWRAANSAACIAMAISSSSWQADVYELVSLLVLLQNDISLCETCSASSDVSHKKQQGMKFIKNTNKNKECVTGKN